MRGESRIGDRFVVDPGEFDIYQGPRESNVVDSGGDANAVGILAPYFDVVRTHESHAAKFGPPGEGRAVKSGRAGEGRALKRSMSAKEISRKISRLFKFDIRKIDFGAGSRKREFFR